MEYSSIGSNPYVSVGNIYAMSARGAGSKEVTKEFTSVFMKMMLKEIFKSQSGTGLFGEGSSGGVYSEMMMDEMIGKLAETDAFGIEKIVNAGIK